MTDLILFWMCTGIVVVTLVYFSFMLNGPWRPKILSFLLTAVAFYSGIGLTLWHQHLNQ